MSAGGLSYSGLINYGKATLPSVDTWGTNMNILRDPPKSITTRRIDKVGQTSSITEMIDESGNRACEAISVYAKGVNPFVSVSYSNVGNNGGQRSGGLTAGGQRAAFLPYTVANDGAFRPPVRRQEDLLPLSRQPRVWTKALTQPGFVDFSKRMRNCGSADETKEVHSQVLHTCVRPTAVYNVETPLKEPFEVKYVIQPTINTSATSGVRSMDITNRSVKEPTKEVNRDMVYAFAQSNLNDKSRSVGVGGKVNLRDKIVDDLRTVTHGTTLSGIEKVDYMHSDLDLERVLPQHSTRTNIGKNIEKRGDYENKIVLERTTPLSSFEVNKGGRGETEYSSREFSLQEKVRPGGFHIPGQVPMRDRMRNVENIGETERSKIARAVSEQFRGRYA